MPSGYALSGGPAGTNLRLAGAPKSDADKNPKIEITPEMIKGGN